MLKGAEALPPWVDVEQPSSNYWISPAMPFLPVRDTMEDDRFEAIALTAIVVKYGKKRKPYVELRPVRIGMTLIASGIAIPDGVSDPDDLCQTLAYGSMPLDAFLKRIIPPLGRSVTSYIFSFYEDGMEVVTNTISGGYHEPQIAVEICRGFDKPKKSEDRSHVYANMLYVFNEGAKSLRKYAQALKNVRKAKV